MIRKVCHRCGGEKGKNASGKPAAVTEFTRLKTEFLMEEIKSKKITWGSVDEG